MPKIHARASSSRRGSSSRRRHTTRNASATTSSAWFGVRTALDEAQEVRIGDLVQRSEDLLRLRSLRTRTHAWYLSTTGVSVSQRGALLPAVWTGDPGQQTGGSR